MLRVFDFKCPNGHVEEHFVNHDTTAIRCSCGREANKIVSPVRTAIDPVNGGSWKATRKWAKAHEQAAQQARKANSE